jgi:hypothetical protein
MQMPAVLLHLPSAQVPGAIKYRAGRAAENAEYFSNTQFPMISCQLSES